MDDKPKKPLSSDETKKDQKLQNETSPDIKPGHSAAPTGRPRKRAVPVQSAETEKKALPVKETKPIVERKMYGGAKSSVDGPRLNQSIAMEAQAPARAAVPEKKKELENNKNPSKGFFQSLLDSIKKRTQKKNIKKANSLEKQKEKQEPPVEYVSEQDEDNGIPMPRARRRRSRKRFWRKVRALAFLGVFVLILFMVGTGAYRSVILAFQEMVEGIKISASPGEGFPMEYGVTGYKGAISMGGNGFAVLGDLDLSLVSSSGRELRRIQHGYVRPGVVAGNNRVCIYSRGGKEYLIEGRSKSIKRGATENEISLAAMSPGGWLALSTSNGRYLSEVEVFNPVGDSVLKWSSNNDIPSAMSFHSSGSVLAIASLKAQDGEMVTHIELLRIGKDKPLADIEPVKGIVLQMKFVGSNRLLVVYSSGFAGLYDLSGKLQGQYDYEERPVSAVSIGNRYTALLFGSVTQGSAELVIINHLMEQTAVMEVPILDGAMLLSADNNVYMLLGQEIAVFTSDGALLWSEVQSSRPLGMVYGGQPLLIRIGAVDSLLHTEKQNDTSENEKNKSMSEAFASSLSSASGASA